MKLQICGVSALSGYMFVLEIDSDKYVWELQEQIKVETGLLCVASEITLFLTKKTQENGNEVKWLHSRDPEYWQLPQAAGKSARECRPVPHDASIPDDLRLMMTRQARLDPSARVGDPAYDLPTNAKSREIHLLMRLPKGTKRRYGPPIWKREEHWLERPMRALGNSSFVPSWLCRSTESESPRAVAITKANAEALKKAC